jgi:hypothetical protein
MKIKLLLFSFLFLISVLANSSQKPKEIIYIYPSPDSKFITVQSNIIIRLDDPFKLYLNNSSIHFEVVGERSGLHAGEIVISDNSVIFKPEKFFVSLSSPLFKDENSYSFSFETNSINDFNPEIFHSVSDDNKLLSLNKSFSERATVGKPTLINGVTVPSDFPKVNVTVSKETAPGKIFMANWGGTSYMMILENDGTPYFYQRFPGSSQTRDFKLQPTGTLTRRVYDNLNCFVEMDSQYTNIDTIRCQNGYGTDEHEIQLLPDHHSFLIALDYHTVDMSKLVSGGQTNATVIGNNIQELDENHNVVFQWNCWDNFDITDAVYENLRANTIDYIHMNSIAIDYDSNIVISSRHLSEVTKINRKTGKIMWRLGGIKNQFTFVNDSYGISYQHDARPVPGMPDQYTIFDDGNFHSPSFSRVVEFKIDTVTMTATKVWEYRHTPDYYTWWMGNAQRLENGNTFIDWADSPLPKAYEVTPTGETVYQADFEQGVPCYRSFRFEWESVVKAPYLVAEAYSDKITLIFNKFGDTNVDKYIVYAGLSPHPTTPIDSTTNTSIDITDLNNQQTYYFRVTARNIDGTESLYSNEESLYVNLIEPGQNFIINGDFSEGTNYWNFNSRNGAIATGSVINGEYYVNIELPGSVLSDIQLIQESFPITNGKRYIFEFDARAGADRLIEPRVAQNGGSYIVYSKTSPVLISQQTQHFKYQFEMTDPTDNYARVVFNCGTSVIPCLFDNVSVREDLLSETDNNDSKNPSDFKLYQNYPNPFNPNTIISWQIPKGSNVSLKIFNILGDEITTLVDEYKPAGKYETEFKALSLPSGIYFYKLQAGDFVQTKKLVLLK